ncbi:hypothetical protein, partial [Geobacillus thermodenitrificans]|uniref:hypothetical protein n=1 Tax=Geobacillus thermodenitrificans TaxID=33940 RepID=UPI003D1E71FA
FAPECRRSATTWQVYFSFLCLPFFQNFRLDLFNQFIWRGNVIHKNLIDASISVVFAHRSYSFSYSESSKRHVAAPIILLNQNIQDSISPFDFHTLRLAVMIFTQKILPALAGRKAENAPERCLSYLDGSTIKNTTHC